jgi:hypothetical protein
VASEAENVPSVVGNTDEQWSLKNDNLRQAKIAMATLAACIVDTLKESDPSFEPRFLARLDSAREKYRNNSDADPQQVLDVLHWTTEMLRGWNPVPDQEGPIFTPEQSGDGALKA